LKNRSSKLPRSSQGTALVNSALRAFSIKGKAERYAFVPHWEEIMGADLAKVTKPVKLIRKNILVIRVADIVWAQELAFRKDELIQRFRSHPHGTYIEDINFVAGNPKDKR
jgi:hypothetical protein